MSARTAPAALGIRRGLSAPGSLEPARSCRDSASRDVEKPKPRPRPTRARAAGGESWGAAATAPCLPGPRSRPVAPKRSRDAARGKTGQTLLSLKITALERGRAAR